MTADNWRAWAGVACVLIVCWLLSENKKRFPALLALGAIVVQAGLVLALFVLPNTHGMLNGVSAVFDGLAAATDKGTRFVFGFLAGGDQPYPLAPPGDKEPFVFAFRVLPLIVVISALSAVLWHWRVLKWLTRLFGFVFEKTLNLGGASALAVAANIFMGMVESPIVIRAYLHKLSRSELFLMMVVGLATVAGSTMVAYAQILAPVLPNAAAHVLVASIISAPAGILLARIVVPETHKVSDGFDYTAALNYESTMDAITRGVQDGLMVAVNVAAFLLVFVAFVWIANGLLSNFGDVGGAPVTLQRGFGLLFAPAAFMIGVPWGESQAAGAILGSKLFLTEFVAFIELGAVPADAMSPRTRMIMTYAVCGFANVGSIGVMTGGMTALMPERRQEILALAWKALPPGFLATLMTAALVAGIPDGLLAP